MTKDRVVIEKMICVTDDIAYLGFIKNEFYDVEIYPDRKKGRLKTNRSTFIFNDNNSNNFNKARASPELLTIAYFFASSERFRFVFLIKFSKV